MKWEDDPGDIRDSLEYEVNSMEEDNNTLDNAGEVGRDLADAVAERVITTVDDFPAVAGSNHTADEQRAAILRLTADNLYRRAEELESE